MIKKMEEKIILNLRGTLNEAQSRWYVAKEAISLGRGGVKRMHELKPQLDRNRYETGIKVSDREMKGLNIQPHQLHPAWNYTIFPRKSNFGDNN